MKKLTLVFISLILSFSSFANDKFTADQLIEKAKAFVSAKNARQQPNTTTKEIDHYISLLSDNFIDEHVKFKFTYTDKSKLRSDMIGKLKDEVINSNIEINEIMVGANVVSLEFNESGLVKHIRRHHG